MQIRFVAAAVVFMLSNWAAIGYGQDALDDLFPEDPAVEATAPADDSEAGGSVLDDLFPGDTDTETPAPSDTAPEADPAMDDLLGEPLTPAPRDPTDEAIDDLLSDEPAATPPTVLPPAVTPPAAQPPVPDLFPTDDRPGTPDSAPGDDLFPRDRNGTPNVDRLPPRDITVPPTPDDSMRHDPSDAMNEPKADPLRTPSSSTGKAGMPGRPYYSANGVYDRIILFDRRRCSANPVMPFYAVDGGYTGEVLNDDAHLLFEDHMRNPNMWPWGVYYSYPNWTVPFTHREFGGPGDVSFHEDFEVSIDWKSFASHQLTDFRSRKRKAAQVNALIAAQPELNKLGNRVDWQEHSWPQMHDVSKRLEYAESLKAMGVRVDYRKYTPEQLLNFLSRVRLAQELDKLGCKVNWRLYSWRQLHDLLLRAEQADDLASTPDADEAEAIDAVEPAAS